MVHNFTAYETEASAKGFRFVLGVDEAGRGPLAGPVVAAAVCLTSFDFENTINDSKKMTEKARGRAFHEIFERGHVGIGMVSEAGIDEVNILNASHMAMETAVMQLVRRLPAEMTAAADFQRQVVLLVDGNMFRSQLPYKHKTIIGGDGKSLSIACASIIAKVTRDRIMDQYDSIFPQYGFKQHKGYPTQMHREAIKTHGPSCIHRKSFTLL